MKVPTAVAVFANHFVPEGEPPREWAERLYNVRRWTPMPGGGHFADEGAANHIRLAVDGRPAMHLFAWGRSTWHPVKGPDRFPARQTLEASHALARLHELHPDACLFPQQSPAG